MAEEPVKVIFRRWRDIKTIFALFPELPADNDGIYCDAYESVGGHGGADYYGCIHSTDPASVKEAKSLIAELKRIGYVLKPIKRASYRMHENRRATARAYRSK